MGKFFSCIKCCKKKEHSYYMVEVKVKDTQSCLTHCEPMKHCDPTDYKVLEILQARILEWVAFPSLGDLPNPRIEPRSPALQGDSLPAESQGKPITMVRPVSVSCSVMPESL